MANGFRRRAGDIRYENPQVKLYQVVEIGTKEVIAERATYRAAENAYCDAKVAGRAVKIVEVWRSRGVA